MQTDKEIKLREDEKNLFDGAIKLAVALIKNKSFFGKIIKSCKNPENVKKTIAGTAVEYAKEIQDRCKKENS